jgi:hypothetical protein
MGGWTAHLTHGNDQLFSVVIPAYNEQEVVDLLALEIISAFAAVCRKRGTQSSAR